MIEMGNGNGGAVMVGLSLGSGWGSWLFQDCYFFIGGSHFNYP